MKRLVFNSAIIEKFAIRTISNSYDNAYNSFTWHDKKDEYDFTLDDKVALEVVSIISKNTLNAIKYEDALDKKKKPDVKRVVDSWVDEDGELLIYYGGDMTEIRQLILKEIDRKNEKRIKRENSQGKEYEQYELCICIDDGGLFNTSKNFNFILESGILKKTKYKRVFLITSSNFFVIENDEFSEYKRIV